MNVRQPFLTKLLTNLMEQFFKCDVIEAFSVLDPAGLLGENEVAKEHLDGITEPLLRGWRANGD